MLVGVLLDRRGGRPRRPEAVGAHPDQLRLAGLVQIRRAERLGVAGAELEDVPDLDRRLDPDRGAVDRVAGDSTSRTSTLSNAKSRPGLDAAQVERRAGWRRRRSRPGVDGLVEQDRHLRADRVR